jgi:hypothetical protein
MTLREDQQIAGKNSFRIRLNPFRGVSAIRFDRRRIASDPDVNGVVSLGKKVVSLLPRPDTAQAGGVVDPPETGEMAMVVPNTGIVEFGVPDSSRHSRLSVAQRRLLPGQVRIE